MTQENELLLIKDLCARAPYRTKVRVGCWEVSHKGKPKLVWYERLLTPFLLHDIEDNDAWEYIKPYLRPISSMTKEEAEEMFRFMYHYPNDRLLKVELEQDRVKFNRISYGECFGILTLFFNKIYSLKQLDWYYSKHFDVRGMIPLNLAIEVTDKNNPYERTD